MKRSVTLWQAVGFALTAFMGTILHYLFEWLGGAIWVSPFSGVNESTWEHMKLLFWPMFLFAIIQSFFFRDRADFWCIKLRGMLLGLLLIPGILYLYNGAVAQSPDWLNIMIFFVAAASAFYYEKRLFNAGILSCRSPKFALCAIILIALLFVIFTFKTPDLNIFKDPLKG